MPYLSKDGALDYLLLLLFKGVRTAENKYTSPILSIHTWNEGKQRIATQHGHLQAIGGPGGMSSDRSK